MKKNLSLKTIGLAMLIATLMLIIAGCGKNVNLEDMFDVEFEGVDGYGTASVNFSKLDDWLDNQVYKERAGKSEKSKREAAKIANDIGYHILYELDQEDHLSNGDKVTLSVKVEEEAIKKYGYELKGFKKEFTVEGLKKATEVDVFEGLKIEFTGAEPAGSAEITDKPELPFNVEYSLDKDEGLSNGEKVKVVAEYDDYAVSSEGMAVKSDEKEYEVSGLPVYLTKAEQLTDENLKPTKDWIYKHMQATTASLWEYEGNAFKAFDYKGYYLLTPSSKNAKHQSILCLVYKFDCHRNDRDVSLYKTFAYYDVKILDDGQLSFDIEDYDDFENAFLDNPFTVGYETLQSLKNDVVTANIDHYNAIENVSE